MGVKVREKVPGSGIWWVFTNHKGAGTWCQGPTDSAPQEIKMFMEATTGLEPVTCRASSAECRRTLTLYNP